MIRKPNLDVLLASPHFADGKHGPDLCRVVVDYVRDHTRVLKHPNKGISFPFLQVIPWLRLNDYLANTYFSTLLLARLNELASYGVVCGSRTLSGYKHGVRGYFVVETHRDVTVTSPERTILELPGFGNIVWPNF